MKITIMDRDGNQVVCNSETVAAELERLHVNPYLYDVDPNTGKLTVGVDGRHLPEPLLPVRDSLNDDLENLTC